MDEDIGQVPARTRPVARIPAPPPRREIATNSKVDGLVGFEAPAEVQPMDVQREPQLGVVPKSGEAPADPSPLRTRSEDGSGAAPWSAAASSIPALRVSRRPTVYSEDAAPEESWDESDFTPVRPASSTTSAPVQSETAAAGSPHAPLVTWLRSVGTPRFILAIAAVAIAVVITALILRPKERFTSIANIKRNAQDLDGQIVNIKGTVGQTFPMGGGFAYYLHQSRDTIVVFTRNRTPLERTRVKLAGTVSTGFLDGVARPAIFEDALLSK